jgi:hypothetical protein
MYEMPMELTELSQDVIWQHVNINMGSLTMMCWLVLPQMLQRRKGAIVNLSSSSSVGPLPYMNIYSASKVTIIKIKLVVTEISKRKFDYFFFFSFQRSMWIIFLAPYLMNCAILESLFKLSFHFTLLLIWQNSATTLVVRHHLFPTLRHSFAVRFPLLAFAIAQRDTGLTNFRYVYSH